METKNLSEKTLELINQYKNFKLGNGVCSVPYFNNRHIKARAKLRAQAGKGNPKDIFDEAESVAILEKIDTKNFTGESLKKFLVDHNIGIDCSGFAYFLLNDESESRGLGSLTSHLEFPQATGLLGKLRTKLRPAENTSVLVLAEEKNSHTIPLKEIKPGDMITMVGGPEGGERDHVLIAQNVEYQNEIPAKIHYTHAIAWPADGVYGHGVREGIIEITNIEKSILEQKWTEADMTGIQNYTFARASKSQTEVRRLNWF